MLAGKRPEEHKPTSKSPNPETIEKFFCFFCGRDFKTKHQRLQHPTTEMWTSTLIWNRWNTTWYNASFRKINKTAWLCICTTSNYCSAATFWNATICKLESSLDAQTRTQFGAGQLVDFPVWWHFLPFFFLIFRDQLNLWLTKPLNVFSCLVDLIFVSFLAAICWTNFILFFVTIVHIRPS